MTGCILVGGYSRRLGQTKALVRLGEATLLEHVIAALSRVYPLQRMLLVTSRPQAVAWLPLATVPAGESGNGPLADLVAALRQSSDEHNLVVASDLPFLSSEILALLLARLPGQLAVVPEVAGCLQPLCAAYARAALPLLEQQLQQGAFGLQRAVEQLSPQVVGESTLRLFDPYLRSFFSISTPPDLMRAQRLLAHH